MRLSQFKRWRCKYQTCYLLIASCIGRVSLVVCVRNRADERESERERGRKVKLMLLLMHGIFSTIHFIEDDMRYAEYKRKQTNQQRLNGGGHVGGYDHRSITY